MGPAVPRASGARALGLSMALALALAGCAGPAADGSEDRLADRRDAALDALLAMRDAEGRWPAGQVPHVAEAAAAAGLDLRTWPEPVPLADQVAWPPEGGPLLAALRPLLGFAFAHEGDGAELERVRERVRTGLMDGQFGDPSLLNDDAYSLLVLAAAGAPPDEAVTGAAQRLLANQSAGGGWPWAVGGSGDTDMTGAVLVGAAAFGGLGGADLDAARRFLADAQADDGGFAQSPGGAGNCDSTAWAIRALDALAEPAPPEAWEFLLGLQRDDGSFAYRPGGGSNALCTAEAATLLGLAVAGDVAAPVGLD